MPWAQLGKENASLTRRMPRLPWETWGNIGINPEADRSRHHSAAQTGYAPATLDVLWTSAEPSFTLIYEGNGRYKTRQEEMFKAQHYFYIFLMYIHTYPEEDKMIDTLETQRIKIGRRSFYKYILPLGRRWATHIDLIRWEDRLSPMNHHAYFPVDVTVIWDTTCFRSLIRYMSICSNHDFCVPLGFSGSGSRGTGLMVVMSSMVNEIPP